MSPTNTYYTTHDLDAYYRDVRPLARLSEQEKAQLASVAQQDSEARNRLIEGHLNMVKAIVIEDCPPHLYVLLPDMLAEANLALVEAAHRYDPHTIDNCTAYFLAYARAYAARARSSALVIHLPYYARVRARTQGTLEQLYQLQPVSLDKEMEWFATTTLEEPPVSALTNPEPAPERDPVKCAQLEQYLSYLPPRLQTVLRLRYGLLEEDEHEYSVVEIATRLGLSRRIVEHAIHDGIAKLRAFVEGKAALATRNGKVCISYPAIHDGIIKPAQAVALLHAYREFEQRGTSVSGKMLATAAGVTLNIAYTFIRQHRGESPKQAKARSRQFRLEQAYARFAAQGCTIGSVQLAREAKVSKRAASDFLHARKKGATDANPEAR